MIRDAPPLLAAPEHPLNTVMAGMSAALLLGVPAFAVVRLHVHGMEPELGHFTRLGLVAVPATPAVSTVAPWGSLRLIGV
ncbi:hypothetical protein ACIGJO_04360 [Streptomyces sp. NPDC079020]|uniref:hypothetical protein n=1 Tax=Streptomyces sp. NPDC079020 TaxID=3365722 RepID=UPI0037D88C70